MTISEVQSKMTKEKGYTWTNVEVPKTRFQYLLQVANRVRSEFEDIFQDGDEIWHFSWNGGPLAYCDGVYLVRDKEIVGYQDGDLVS